ncbi:hypothetical protein OXX80_000566 [Metschnikowia pulcherrima]
MAKLAVPSPSARLEELLSPVLAKKHLGNDALWRNEILPLIQSYLEGLGHSVRQSATTNANAPAAKIIDEINREFAEISRILASSFASEAPFTIQRVAELLLAYRESGYSLATVASAQKWLAALARTVSVTTSESAYASKRRMSASASASTAKNGETNEISESERQALNLPPNIRFVRLDWASDSYEDDKNELPNEPAAKRQKYSETLETGSSSEQSQSDTNSVEANDASTNNHDEASSPDEADSGVRDEKTALETETLSSSPIPISDETSPKPSDGLNGVSHEELSSHVPETLFANSEGSSFKEVHSENGANNQDGQLDPEKTTS